MDSLPAELSGKPFELTLVIPIFFDYHPFYLIFRFIDIKLYVILS